MINAYLCSFASPDLNLSVKRFKNQSEKLNFYNGIKVFGLKDLSSEKQKQLSLFFKKGQKRLYGYSCWKPEIILKYLNEIPPESILQYSDVGCHFNFRGIKRLSDYIQITNKNNILSFKYNKPDFNFKENFKFQIYYEYQYTKADTWKYFKVDQDSEILKTEQVWSGTMFFKNNSYVKNFLNEWANVCKISKLIDDSESVEPNHSNFIEHRHDQSIFSIMCKKENIYNLSASECEWAELENKRSWEHLINYPIWAKRDKKFNLFKRFINRQKKNIKKFLKI